jgi:hypothetical protein
MRRLNEDRSSAWMELLHLLTEVCADCAVDGDVSEGFAGIGDIDLIAPTRSWPIIEREFLAWAVNHELRQVIVCRHRPGVLILLAGGEHDSTFYEMEVRAIRYFRGTLLFEAGDLAPLTKLDSTGVRRLGSGAGGLMRLIVSGTRWSGQLKWNKERLARVSERMRRDPQGVAAAAEVFGWAKKAALLGAESAVAGEWNRRAMLTVTAWALLKSLSRPDALVRRTLRRDAERECLVLRTLIQNKKEIPDDFEKWLDAVRVDHRVHQELG